MEIKKIKDGMTGKEVAELLDSNFEQVMSASAHHVNQSVSLFDDIETDDKAYREKIAKISQIIKSIKIVGVPPSTRLYIWSISKPEHEIYNSVINIAAKVNGTNQIVCSVNKEDYGKAFIKKDLSIGGCVELTVDWDKLSDDILAFAYCVYPISIKCYIGDYTKDDLDNIDKKIADNHRANANNIDVVDKKVNSYLIQSKNLLNLKKCEVGFLDPKSGIIQKQFKDYLTTDFLVGYNGYKYVMNSKLDPNKRQIRSFCVYDGDKNYIWGKEKEQYDGYALWLDEAIVNNTPNAIFIRICFSYSELDNNMLNLYLTEEKSRVIYPKSYVPNGNIINPDCIYINKFLHDKDILVFGDSKSARKTNWSTVFSTITGVRHCFNCAVGGASVIYNESGTINDEIENVRGKESIHLISQVINCAKTIINNDSISIYKAANRYIIKPDIVFFSFGYNDIFGPLKRSNITQSQYSNISSLTLEQLSNQSFDLQSGKYYANYRYVIELLKSKVISYANLDIDCTLSKFFIISPSQAYSDKPEESNVGLKDMYNLLKPIGDDYSIPIIDSYRKSGICGRFERKGSEGIYLEDGVHMNKKGYERVARLIAGNVLSTYYY